MNCVDFVVDFCLHITSHVSQAFATQHKLLFAKHCTYNCVYLWSDQSHLKNTLSYMQNCFVALKKGRLLKSKFLGELSFKILGL